MAVPKTRGKASIRLSIRRFVRKYDLSGFLFVLPALILLGMFMFYPLIATFYYSLTNFNIVRASIHRVGELQSYAGRPCVSYGAEKHACIHRMCCSGLRRLVVTFGSVSQPCAQGHRCVPFHHLSACAYIHAGCGYYVENPVFRSGLYQRLLQWAGITKAPLGFLSDPDIALYSIVFVTLWKAAGYYMMIYLGGLQQIPVELDEAAVMDGANAFRRFWHVTLPLLRPSIVLVVIISAIGSLKVFGEVYVMTDGGPADSTNVMVYYIYQQAFRFLKMGYASALGVVLFLLLFVFSLLYLKRTEGQYVTY